jgi:hypothetical protein
MLDFAQIGQAAEQKSPADHRQGFDGNQTREC